MHLELSKIISCVNSSNKSTEIIRLLESNLLISELNKFPIHIWLIWIEQSSKFALLIVSKIVFTLFLGKDVRKYLL